MNKHKRHVSLQTVPFSWEDMPGISKAFDPHIEEGSKKSVHQPERVISSNSSKTIKEISFHGPHLMVPVPPPPCAYQYETNLKTKGFVRPEEDPFLAAYIECTKTVKEKKKEKKSVERRNAWAKIEKLHSWAKIEKLNSWAKIDKLSFGFSSCKSSCGVREGSLVKLPKFSEADYHVDELE
ncbi:hypothetical protein LUZ60_005047 [Juncus effusus]|nr:hypothetical protein LUZ60_005047 [Juncus effusus]